MNRIAQALLPVFFLASGLCLGDDRQSRAKELIALGVTSVSEQKPDEAIRYLTEALSLQPSREYLWYVHLFLAFAHGNRDDLIAMGTELDRALQSDPPTQGLPSIHLARAGLFDRLCKPDLALAEVQRAKELAPRDVHALGAHALVLFSRKGDYAKAMADFDQAVNIAETLEGNSSTSGVAYAYWKRAEARLRLGYYELALADIEKSLGKFPRYEAILGRGEIRLTQGDLQGAKSDCEQALQFRPGDPEAEALLGRIALWQGKTQKAKEIFSRAQRIVPVDGPVVAFSEGKTNSALAELERHLPGMNCEPRDAVQTCAMLLYVSGQTGKAYSYLDRALGETGWPCHFWPVLVLAAEQSGDPKDAVAKLRIKMERFPQDIWAVKLTKLALGERRLEETVLPDDIPPNRIQRQRNGDAFYIAGEMEKRRGNLSLANTYFKRAVDDCQPNSIMFVMARERLRQASK